MFAELLSTMHVTGHHEHDPLDSYHNETIFVLDHLIRFRTKCVLDQHCDKKCVIYFHFRWKTLNEIHMKMHVDVSKLCFFGHFTFAQQTL